MLSAWLFSGDTDTPTLHEARTLTGHDDTISTVSFSPSGRLLASCSYDFTVRLCDPKTGDLVLKLQGDDQILSCSFSRDESMLTTTNNASKVRVSIFMVAGV